uniref:Uncharacterized protein n=1 Tax=Anguilla anguilla TaxID=7936 RepID=A0A0E9SJQ5_ANGAN
MSQFFLVLAVGKCYELIRDSYLPEK